ncbi:MAG: radical SAM protein [Alicyclobacillus sp.]|nr:radical SAM protein [Alicyclobacillus sp.]
MRTCVLLVREVLPVQRPTFEPVQAKQVLNRVQTPAMPFAWSLNPYRGCTHGCSFCYARAFQPFLGLEADDTFQTRILVKVNAPEALDRQLEQMARRHRWNLQALARELGTVVMGTATDPYQPVEAKAGVTRECLKVLAAYRVPVSITTRSPLILRDLDLLCQMDIRAVHVSIHTLDHRVWRNLEPATPSPEKRLEAVRQLTEAGLCTGVFMAPAIPYLTDGPDDVEALLSAARLHGARFVVPSLLRLTPEVKAWFFRVVEERYPQLAPRLRRLYPGTEARPEYAAAFLHRVRRQMEAHGLSDHAPPRLARAHPDRRGTEAAGAGGAARTMPQASGTPEGRTADGVRLNRTPRAGIAAVPARLTRPAEQLPLPL